MVAGRYVFQRPTVAALLSRGLAVAGLGLLLAGCGHKTPATAKVEVEPPATSYVGTAACVACHATEAAAWRDSHHAKAMQPATADTVLGDFHDATFRYGGLTSRFSTRDGRYFVTTDGADGRLAEGLAAPAVSRAVPGRPAAGAVDCLGRAFPRQRWPSLVSPLRRSARHGRQSPALDSAKPELEFDVCRVPLDQPSPWL